MYRYKDPSVMGLTNRSLVALLGFLVWEETQ
jgi:hypothetical protein